MKRALLLLIVLGLAMAGIECALSLVPHTHGGDVDHSKHTACPIHQAAQQDIQLETSVPVFPFDPAPDALIAEPPLVFPALLIDRGFPSRGPPARA